MSSWMKCFENGGKNMSFKIDNDWVYFKYNEIWNKIRELLNGVKVRNDVAYSSSYTETRVKTFREVIKKLYVLIMSRTRFRVNPHSIVA